MARFPLNKDAPAEQLLKSDSEDENYDDEAAKSTPRKPKRRPKSAKKSTGRKTVSRSGAKTRRKNAYSSDDDEEISESAEDSLLEDAESDVDEPKAPVVEYGPTGRPKRSAVKANPGLTYKENSDDEDGEDETESRAGDDDDADDADDDDDGNDDDNDDHNNNNKDDDDDDNNDDDDDDDNRNDEDDTLGRRRSAAKKKPRTAVGPRVITLKYGFRNVARLESLDRDTGPKRRTVQTRMATRALSATPSQRPTVGGKGPVAMAAAAAAGPPKSRGRQASAEPQRRSSRLTQTDEPMAALSNSGKHVVVTNLPGPSSAALQVPESPAVEEPSDPHVSVIEELPEPSSEDLSNGAGAPVHLEVRESQHDPSDQPEPALPAEGRAQSVGAGTGGDPASRDDTGHEADEDEDDGISTRRRTRVASARQRSTGASSPRPFRSTADPESAGKAKPPEARRLERRVKPKAAASRKAGGNSDDEDYHEEGGEEEHSDDSMFSRVHTPVRPPEDPGRAFDDPREDVECSDARNPRIRKRVRGSQSEDPESQAELAAELEDLQPSPKRPRRTQRRLQFSGNESGPATEPRLRRRTQQVDYRLLRPEMAHLLDDNDAGTTSPSKRKTGSAIAPSKSLFDTNGPFGGGDAVPFFSRGAPALETDSDSSDDDAVRRRGGRRGGTSAFGATVTMTPTGGAHPPGLLPGIGQTHNSDPLQAGAPTNLGRITKPGKNALADADPLGVSPDVTFDSVGGLDDRIQQLKEMVMLPLMYPEIFKAKKVVPPRGVLFHGPPGTGKTLLARAVASSFTGADGKKVTFYMRKGADCLSKWVGEAERQLRLLFDEARNNQPSIIFFDEIDGLAPVRSSKQEQIHASIVSTLLALMDGMDGRGQVVVIGATNRPDSVDPALRRPGRFDREFYFPLPATEARRSIIEIHSKGWEPPLSAAFKDQLAVLTKGYGGADLRALCTEAALNAMQRTYPQIYKSVDKLKVDPARVVVTARDFMISLKKITPSSERSTASSAAPLPEQVRPLLSKQLERIKECLKGIFPEFKRLTALEEAEYEDETMDAEEGFEREMMMENFESSRVYRPRLLIHGMSGLGQQYLAGAVLHFMESVHVQSFDLGTLLSDATRAPETAIVQLFTEIKRHKPSVIFIPNVDVWYRTLPETAIATFKGLLQSVASNDRVLLFGISEQPVEALDQELTRDLFGYSRRDRFELERPDEISRFHYFDKVMSLVRRSPRDFPQDPKTRKKRKLPELARASPPPKRVPTEEEKRALALKDRQLKNHLKLRLNNLMETLKQKYRRFKKPVFDHEVVMRILDPPPPDPNIVVSDIPQEAPPHVLRPFQDEDGVLRVEDTSTKKIYYNMDLDVIEDRFSNGYYSTPRQFLADLERVRHDAKLFGDKENQRKANEMLTNSEVYIADIESDASFIALCEEMHEREKKRIEAKKAEAERKRNERQRQAETAAASESTAAASAGPSGPGDVPIVVPKTPAAKQHDNSVLSNGGSHSDAVATAATSQRHQSNRDSDFGVLSTPGLMAAPSQPTQLTQLGSNAGGSVGVTRVATMELSMVINDASATTSGGRNSGATAGSHSYHSNGFVDPIDAPSYWGDFGQLHKGDSQLPPTQVLQFSQGQHSGGSYTPSAHAPGLQFPYSQTDSSPASVPNPSQVFPIVPPPAWNIKCSPVLMGEIHDKLAKATSGYSVEQLEQVNAALMDHVWKSKSNFDRDEVARTAYEVFEDVHADIRAMQSLLAVSRSFE